ncbi:UDP-N-acetylmuramoyl-tripeptide--D-alanyl-D-alanine ligase, partial [Erythrobacter sp.]|uniref:UDP-N-acetylmuramoyl-tripeptide--D-alanyl-D- alanine ligase n=1 Tax=Erythrobacter sp. TaxID=1042 RepID=UPI003C73F784
MSAAHALLHDWPVDPRDALPLALWDADAIAAATGGTASDAFQVSGVEMDSRDVRPGDLFVALKGAAMDGHKFLAAAFEKGAVAALVDRPVDFPHVLVEDTTAALHALARAACERGDARRIAVTGSVGKTGVKEAIFASLDRASRGAAHRSVRSYNNHVGVPLSLARMPARARFGVFEMGMNNAGEIAPLADHVRPHVALITTIAPAHIENLGSIEAIADEKAQIFAGLAEGGIAIIPADSEHADR